MSEKSSEYKSKKYKSVTKQFENEVFLYLYENRNDLGIEEVCALKNMLVDGLLKLRNGKVILLEIKYALSWLPCCNARVEFQGFIAQRFYQRIPEKQQPEKALIIFHHFSRPWQRRPGGWSFFYEEEENLRNKFPTISVDIAQLTDSGLRGMPRFSSE